jgi:hypothetical protein
MMNKQSDNMKRYVYIFTRQDIFREYQLVQSSHVAYKLGAMLGDEADPDNTYFTCVGVRNADALVAVQKILQKFGFKYEIFNEPDMANEDYPTGQFTAIAVYPVDEDKRDILLAFNLLKF